MYCNRAIGYLGLAQKSPVLAMGVSTNPHRGLLKRQMLVVGNHGCKVGVLAGVVVLVV